MTAIKGKTLIYSLNCPITNEIRYIGKTAISLNSRFKNHLKPKGHSKRAIWIRELISNNLNPILKEIEYCDSDTWKDREIYYISKYSHLSLLNENKGGGGGSANLCKLNYIEIFRNILENNKYSKRSISNYTCCVSMFLKENKSCNPKKIKGRTIEEYINEIKNENTRNGYIIALKLFYKLVFSQNKKITYVKYTYSHDSLISRISSPISAIRV